MSPGRSSRVYIGQMAAAAKVRIVSIEGGSADEFMMVLNAIKTCSGLASVAVVLTGRPVDLSVVSFNLTVKVSQVEQLGLSRVESLAYWTTAGGLRPASLRWVDTCVGDASVDKGFEDLDVVDDSDVYVRAIAARLISFLASFELYVGRQYSLYAISAKALSLTAVVPVVSHGSRGLDFMYSTPPVAGRRVADVVSLLPAGSARSPALRAVRRTVCKGLYESANVAQEFGLVRWDNLALLLREVEHAGGAELWVGSPMSVLAGFCQQANLLRVVAVGWSAEESSKLPAYQYNVVADLAAAYKCFEIWRERRIPTLIVPAEVVTMELHLPFYEIARKLNANYLRTAVLKLFEQCYGRDPVAGVSAANWVTAALVEWAGPIYARAVAVVVEFGRARLVSAPTSSVMVMTSAPELSRSELWKALIA